MAYRSKSVRERVRMLGQADLGAAAQILTGEGMWSKQRQIARAVSRPRSKVAVPSCNASGKTWLAARIAAAFYEAYTPGTPCLACGGPCRGAKVITTSSKEEHLRDNLWGELRTVRNRMAERDFPMAGRYLEGDLRIVESEANHFITGQSASTAEGMQGYHSAHKLIIGDEATSVSDEVKLAIMRLLATSDARLLLIYNPTTPDTYAAQQARSPRVETIRITAWDTPYFTDEPVPEGANLITPEFLDDLKASGDGPGTFVWVTSIEAKDWDLADDLLIPGTWFDRNIDSPVFGATRQLGVDMASYGSDENVIAVRDGDHLVDLLTFPSMRMDVFWDTHVSKVVRKYQPHYLAYDADGVGAGVTSDAEAVRKYLAPGGEILPFRGGLGVGARYFNARSAWWWMLRRRFENDHIKIAVPDPRKLRDQITDIHYTVTPKGEIRVETKQEMRKRGVSSPDIADGVMYAFALAEELSMPEAPKQSMAEEVFGVKSRSEESMWEKDMENLRGDKRELNPVFGCPDDW